LDHLPLSSPLDSSFSFLFLLFLTIEQLVRNPLAETEEMPVVITFLVLIRFSLALSPFHSPIALLFLSFSFLFLFLFLTIKQLVRSTGNARGDRGNASDEGNNFVLGDHAVAAFVDDVEELVERVFQPFYF
jgi:hypothetical protein